MVPRKKPQRLAALEDAARNADGSLGVDAERWELRLYVAGKTPRCLEAFKSLKEICEARLEGRYSIEVVDLLENPTLAEGDQILAIPTLVRKLPPPMKKIIGDLSNTERVLVGLNLTSLPKPPAAKPSAAKLAVAKPAGTPS